MVEAGETIVTEIVLFPLQQKGEDEEEEIAESKDDKHVDVVVHANPDDEERVLKKLEGKTLKKLKTKRLPFSEISLKLLIYRVYQGVRFCPTKERPSWLFSDHL